MMMNSDRNTRKINRVRKKINKGRSINRDIMKVFGFFVVIFAALIIFFTYFLSFGSSSVINSSYNRRSDALTKTVKRGSILASDGTRLAYSEVAEDGTETRIYPYSNVFAHVVGFSTNGRLGLESSYNYYLLTSHLGIFDKISNEFHNRKNSGDDILTTLDVGLQNYVYDALGDNYGAAICMNPDTGEIYALVSKPDFDPNVISEIWDSIVSSGTDEEGAETTSDSTVLLNRATQGLYTPGSTFKIFTLYEYCLENPTAAQDFAYNCSGEIAVGDTSLSCYSGAHGQENLRTAFANSCNCAFGTIGAGLDLNKFSETTSKLLFDTALPVDLSSYESRFSLSESDTDFDIMATAIGQGNTLVSPLHLVMVISAIANDGVCMTPHTVSAVLNPSGETIKQFRNEEYATLFTEEEAASLKEYLRAVVTDGTAQVLYPGNFVAYGKTGTAQKERSDDEEYDHSWFVGWAENNEQKLAVCVILEDADAAGTTSANITKQIFDYYFN